MIAITNEAGLSLKLDADQGLTLERSAGWLQDEVLPGAKSYPIEFPIKPNEAFLQSGYRPDSARPFMEFAVTVKLANVLYRRCLLSYKVTNGKGSGYLKIDGGEVFSKLKKLTLQDVLTDEVVLTSFSLDPLQLKLKKIAAMAPGDFPLTFFPIRNEAFFEEGLKGKITGVVQQPYVNAWGQLPGGGYGFLLDSESVKGYPISPQFYLTWVLKRIFAWAGYRITGDWIGDAEIKMLVILNQTAISRKSPGLLTPNVTSSAIAGQHVPKMSVGDFLMDIRKEFGLLFDFDGNLQTVTIRSFKQILRTPARDLSKYIAGNYDIDGPSGVGYSLKEGIDSQDELFKDEDGNAIPGATFTIGGSPGSDRTEVTLPVCATQYVYEPAPMGGYWMVPLLRQAGNALDFYYQLSDRYPDKPKKGETSPQLKNDIGLRLVSYRGMVQSSNGSLYPLGTPDVRDGRQVKISQKGTRLGGNNGLWRSDLSVFYYFRDQTRPVTIPLDLPVALAASLKFYEPIGLRLSGQAMRTYLIDKLQAQSPGSSGIMECKLFALTLPDGLDQPLPVDAPIIWLELIISNETFQPGLYGYRSLTVKCWADAARSQVAIVSNLAINIRNKWRHEKPSNVAIGPIVLDYNEFVTTYYATGTTAVLESNLLTNYVIRDSNGESLNEYKYNTLSLDPGDDYLIIP